MVYLSDEKLSMMDEAEVLYSINKFFETNEVDFVNIKKLRFVYLEMRIRKIED